MIEPPLQRRIPLPPQLTRRVGVLGVVTFVLLGIIVFRLWYLQVLTGPQNVAVASANDYRTLPLPAPRGEILDSDGKVIAGTRVAWEAAIVADDLPPAGSTKRRREYARLGRVLGMSARDIAAIIDQGETPAYEPAAIRADLGRRALVVLEEQASSFPGVVALDVAVRSYPHHQVAGVVLGQVGPISSTQVGKSGYKGIAAGNYVGQSGLEAQYNSSLQGKDGVEHIQVDAAGLPTRKKPKITPPTPGDDLKTSLDLGLEEEGYAALEKAEQAMRAQGAPAKASAFVAMNPFTGRVLALGSLPSYDPSMFVTPPSQSEYERVLHEDDPFVDRAIDGLYPTGSTFKPITALASLKAGLITPQTLQGETDAFADGAPCVEISADYCPHNSGGANYGNLDLEDALEVSEDTFFYLLGEHANDSADPLAIQDEAHELGLGRSPGIDLPGGGQAGLVPDATLIQHLNDQYVAEYCEPGTPPTRPKPRYAHNQTWVDTCQQGFYLAPWTVGQDVELATGQGQLEASPMQMAIVYSAIANGGTVFSPRIGEAIDSPSGQLVEQLPPPPARHVAIDPAARAVVLAGLHLAAQGASGTSCQTFCSFPRTIYGKTGTAVHTGQVDQSWYVAYASDPDPEKAIVVAVTVEQGGFGAQAAAPAARLILSKWFGLPEKWLPGTSTTL